MFLTAAYCNALFSSNFLLEKSFTASAAPCINSSMLIPAAAIGNNPTGVKTENLPPTLSGTTNVSYFSVSANVFNAPFALSVVA